MISKISLLSALVIGTGSFLTWGGLTFKDNYQHNSKMREYEEWREEFYKQELYDSIGMCKFSSKEECLNKELSKYYLPFPKEDKLWEKAYESLEENRKQDSPIKQITNSYSSENKQLLEVKNPEDLKNYCYGRVKEAIQKYKDTSNKDDFIVSNSGRDEERCVLSVKELKK